MKGLFRGLFRSGRQTRQLDPAKGYGLWAADYGDEPNALQRLEADALDRLLPDLAGRSVLDVGCGKGRVSELARVRGARRTLAADFSLAMLARTHRLTPRLAADVRALPFRPESFDAVVCALVLGHVRDLDRALGELAAVLVHGGHLLISDFHPFATLRGWQRTFVDPESGRTFAIEQHLHLMSDYVRAFGRSGLVLEALEEPLWQGQPVVFVLRARKS